MADTVTITATSRYLYVSRADGSLLSRHLTVEDAIEAAVNAGAGEYRITYPDRTVKVYGTVPATPAPAAPTELVLDEVTAGFVTLSWTDDGTGTNWTVYRDGAPIGTSASVAYTDSTVVPSTAYSYQVQASNSSGSSALSAALAVTTSANSVPSWSLTDQSGSIGQAYALNLNTVCSDEDNHALTYSLVSGSVPGLTLVSPNYAGTPTTAGAYPLTFRANDGYGTTDVSITFTVADPDVTAPTVPSNVSASANGSTVTVTWTASTDASGVANYRVYRDGAFRATSSAPPYVESGVAVGSYSYTVSAVDASANANESAQSSSAPVTVAPANPDVPINFTATGDGATTINLSWAAGPNGAVPDDYDLDFSATSASGPWTSIPFTGTATTYAHTGRTAGVTYYYRVRAGAGAVESSYATASAVIGAVDFTIPASLSSRTINGASATAYGTTSWASLSTGGKTIPGPGDVIQLASGTHGRITWQRLTGASGNPITIRSPQGAAVTVSVSTTGWVWQFLGCQHVTVDGGLGGQTYGIRFVHTGSATSGAIYASNYSTTTVPSNMKFRNLEISGGYTIGSTGGFNLGIHIRSAPGTKATSGAMYGKWYDGFLFENLYVHNVRGEGLYLGPNIYDLSLPLKNIEVSNCIFDTIGREAVQGKSYFAGVNSIHHCIARNCGARNEASQNSVFSILWGQGDMYANRVEGRTMTGTTSAHGLQWWTGTDQGYTLTPTSEAAYGHTVANPFVNRAYNNIVFNVQDGIAMNSNAPAPQITALIYNNTVTQNRGRGITASGLTGSYYARNNIVLANTSTNINMGNAASNTTGSSVTGKFVDAENSTLSQRDYRLLAADPVEVPYNTSIAATDYAGIARSSASADKGAYEFQ